MNPPAELALSGRSSLSRSHVKISCPGCSQISHTSSPSGDALSDIVVESDILLERDETDPLEDRVSSGGSFRRLLLAAVEFLFQPLDFAFKLVFTVDLSRRRQRIRANKNGVTPTLDSIKLSSSPISLLSWMRLSAKQPKGKGTGTNIVYSPSRFHLGFGLPFPGLVEVGLMAELASHSGKRA